MNPYDTFPLIRTFIFDVDGVFTNSQLLITEKGELLRQMNVRDGYAVKRALRAGYRIAIITGGDSDGVEHRLRALGIQDIFRNVSDKLSTYLSYIGTHNIPSKQVMYMGDDLPDLGVMKKVALATCPADADSEIRRIADYVSPLKGGEGCVRDIIEKIMRINEQWLPSDLTAKR